MPRISVKLIAERETFVNNLFTTGTSLEQAQEALVAKYQMKMNPYRLKELFDAAVKKAPTFAELVKRVESVGPLPTGQLAVSGEPGPKASFPNKPTSPFVPVVVKAQKPSYFDNPTPVVTKDGCMPIRELIEAIEKGEVP